MNGYDEPGRWREMAAGLRGLRPEPPPTLRPAVLERVGLADAFITVEGPAGPLLVAYNGRGISATAPAEEEGRFLERFQARYHRPLRRAGEPPAPLVAELRRYLDPAAPGAAPDATSDVASATGGRSHGRALDRRRETARRARLADRRCPATRAPIRAGRRAVLSEK